MNQRHDHRSTRAGSERRAVLDVETTGLGRQDRIVEIAIVCVDDGDVVDEFTTLVDPQREVGAVDVHGITPQMLRGAPTFQAIAPAVADRLDGRVLAAHNASFAARVIDRELRRVGLELSAGRPISTLRRTGSRLNLACAAHGVELEDGHRALHAARATADLLARCDADDARPLPASVFGCAGRCSAAVARRPTTVETPHSELHELVARVHYPAANPQTLAYLDALDWALNGQAIDSIEPERLAQLASDLGLSTAEHTAAHDLYMDAVAAVVHHSATGSGAALLTRIARCLGRDAPSLPPGTGARIGRDTVAA